MCIWRDWKRDVEWTMPSEPYCKCQYYAEDGAPLKHMPTYVQGYGVPLMYCITDAGVQYGCIPPTLTYN
jgi:hypothetical protein